MTIAVLLKQVPDTTAKISVSGGRVDESAVSKWSMSPYDEYALEAALQLKEAGEGDVVAITCGPARAAKMLTDAAAVGADTLILIPDDGVTDSTHVQSLLAAAVKRSGSDVVDRPAPEYLIWLVLPAWEWFRRSLQGGMDSSPCEPARPVTNESRSLGPASSHSTRGLRNCAGQMFEGL